jgi:hypothetical protein
LALAQLRDGLMLELILAGPSHVSACSEPEGELRIDLNFSFPPDLISMGDSGVQQAKEKDDKPMVLHPSERRAFNDFARRHLLLWRSPR